MGCPVGRYLGTSHRGAHNRSRVQQRDTRPETRMRHSYRTLRVGTSRNVELTGFEPVTPSLRKMRSNRADQGKRYALAGLWRDCGASGVRRGET